jgi:FkbM family methyltransferase
MAALLGRIIRGLRENNSKGKRSFSQCGEDLIIDFIFRSLKIPKPTYLDIGAYHPIYLSNTYYFYKKGVRGVCVEPDPQLFERFRKKRHGDVTLNVGVSAFGTEKADFYVMSSKTLNTFSKEEAERYQSFGHQKIERIIQVPCISINDIFRDYFPRCPDFVSIDVEGKELELLSTIDFNTYRPIVFCIETLSYTEDRSERKLFEIIDFILSKNYILFADTYINSIFVDRQAWQR